MKEFIHLLRHDFRVLQRNKVVQISVAVTLVYMLILKGLSVYIDPSRVLVMIIFNDPALLGFLFVGAMVLFEKNENTLQALSVVPIKVSNYILSKTVALTLISVLCCTAMTIYVLKDAFNLLHFISASVCTTLLFSFVGFILIANVATFNRFILNAVGFLIALSLPFLGYFEVLPRTWFLLFPSQACIDLFRFAFQGGQTVSELIYAYVAISLWLYVSYRWAINRFKKFNFA